MRCPIQHDENAELLLAYCDRKLSPDAMEEMERHVVLCADCREFAAAQQLVWEALDTLEALPVSPDFNRRLYQRIDREAAAPWHVRAWRRAADPVGIMNWKPAMGVAAACLTLVAGFLLEMPPAPSDPLKASRGGEAVEISIEQVERAVEDLEMLRQIAPLDRSAHPGARHSL